RPAATPVGTALETASNDKLKDVNNLTAKTDIVYEEPGEEKGVFSRVVDKLNPFSSSGDGKKAVESPTELAAKKTVSEKEDSPGVLGSLWNGVNPFGGQKSQSSKPEAASNRTPPPRMTNWSIRSMTLSNKRESLPRPKPRPYNLRRKRSQRSRKPSHLPRRWTPASSLETLTQL